VRERCLLVTALLRPPVLLILALFAAIGNAAAGGRGAGSLVLPLIAVTGTLIFAVATNDLADADIDRVNLAGDRRRALAAGTATTREFRVFSILGAAAALVASALIGAAALAVTAGSLCLCAAYSFRPLRIADRGVLAPMVLPACYVAGPYLIGRLAVRPSLTGRDAWLLVGLYVGFVGRIILKDFRDVRGDRLFGKRTFLIRHGRRATCVTSAVCWTAGTSVLAAASGRALRVTDAAFLAAALVALRLLATSHSVRRDERLISVLAILGRGTVTGVLIELATRNARWSAASTAGVILAFGVVTLGQAWIMLRDGPRTTMSVPASWTACEAPSYEDGTLDGGADLRVPLPRV